MYISMSEITMYVIRSVFIISKCLNLSGISREYSTHCTIKPVIFNSIEGLCFPYFFVNCYKYTKKTPTTCTYLPFYKWAGERKHIIYF